MVIEIQHDRMVVGLRKEEWTKVLYEPIEVPEDLATPDLAPEVSLYSRSRGKATENEPMFGEVAWEPLLNHEYFGSSAKAERCLLQRKILYDAWRYLVAKDPADIATIRAQLQGSHRQRKLLKELDKARKARSNGIKQRDQRRARKLQRLDQGLPAESIEKSDDDSGLGSDSDDDSEDGEDDDNESRRRMPPPGYTVRRRPLGSHRGSVEPLMSGGLGRYFGAESNAASPSGQTTTSRGVKRKQPAGPELPRARAESQGVIITPPASGRPPRSEQNVEEEDDGDNDDDEDEVLGMLGSQNANGGLGFKEAIAAATRRSLAPC